MLSLEKCPFPGFEILIFLVRSRNSPPDIDSESDFSLPLACLFRLIRLHFSRNGHCRFILMIALYDGDFRFTLSYKRETVEEEEVVEAHPHFPIIVSLSTIIDSQNCYRSLSRSLLLWPQEMALLPGGWGCFSHAQCREPCGEEGWLAASDDHLSLFIAE